MIYLTRLNQVKILGTKSIFSFLLLPFPGKLLFGLDYSFVYILLLNIVQKSQRIIKSTFGILVGTFDGQCLGISY